VKTFDFKLVLDQVEIDEAEADALYARCKDATLITAAGVTWMDFDRPADSLDEAVRSAMADVNAAGFRVKRIEIEADSLTPQRAVAR
jgi:hypothetical protein